MKYLIDSANIEKIRACLDCFPIDGVTTNPSLVSKDDTGFKELISGIRELIGKDRIMLVQTTAHDADSIVEEGKALKEFVGGNFYLKIPATPQGLKAVYALSQQGIKTAVTTVFTPQQALLSAQSGASFVALFINRFESSLGDGGQLVEQTARLFDVNGCECEILAASFKNAEQVNRVMLAGADAVTVPPEIYPSLISHPLTDIAIERFNSDWKTKYGEKTVLDLI